MRDAASAKAASANEGSSRLIRLIRSDPRASTGILGLVAVQSLMSIRFFFEYIDGWDATAYVLYVILTLVVWLILLRIPRCLEFVLRLPVFALAVVVLFLLDLVVYPKADALKAEGRGSDRDDCVAVMVTNIFELRAPFGRGTFNDPCSTGPSEFLVYFPVQLSTNYFIVVPALATIFGFWVLTLVADRAIAIIVSLTQFGSWLLLEMSATGSDMIIIAWALAAAVAASRKGLRTNSTALVVVGALGYCVFAGSRIPLALIAMASATLLLVEFGRRALRVIVPAAIAVTALYLGTYLAAPAAFTPGHMIGKTDRILRYLGGGSIIPALVALAILTAGVAYAGSRGSTRDFIRRYYYSLNLALVVAPMLAVGFWDLRRRDLDLAGWEGLHYFYLWVPLLLVAGASWLKSLADFAAVGRDRGSLPNVP